MLTGSQTIRCRRDVPVVAQPARGVLDLFPARRPVATVLRYGSAGDVSRAALMRVLDPQSLPRHVDRLYRAAWALCGSPHDAEDLVQETFARVLARPRLLSGQDELAYLMRALRNTFLTQRRAASRRPQTGSTPIEGLEPADPRTAGRPVEALQTREIFKTIAGLAENHRLALVAVDVVGLSYREAAAALGIREATIATRVFRAREQMALRLPRDGDTTAAGRVTADGRSASPERADDRARGAPAPQAPRKVEDPAGVLLSEATHE
jgi:RNA polymerase sigma-70 factor, ECF subfamily